MSNCNDCPNNSDTCCSQRPSEVQSANADDRAWQREFDVVVLRDKLRQNKEEE